MIQAISTSAAALKTTKVAELSEMIETIVIYVIDLSKSV